MTAVTSRAAVGTTKRTVSWSVVIAEQIWDLRILAVVRQKLQVQQGTQGFQAQHQACSKAKTVSSQGHSASRTETSDTGDETRQTGTMAELKH